ncbi:DEAD/DEAH box helicase [Nocardia camponoti]|uniref:ATP-dependent helicase HrpB n=1 Tax=Nocardia camponoti TaxID=1616106 RepID=A0A917QM93_9NOCA|nr:DEAD/DEAH box helicase [Nocardia camponoti]GGK58733.1 hypothetical protein GCM10011591_33690 [Nocardia camponoti]
MPQLDLAALPDLPVRSALTRIGDELAAQGGAVLVAPPGTGKTTLVPLALADRVSGRVIVAEPRRIAARAAATRMAALLGERVGETVGYSVRGERKVSAGTRIEVVTSGLLVRRLQNDPELAGVDVVVLDEIHERHLDADLLFALLLDARDGLRPDLRLLATSATVAADRVAGVLGDPAPIIEVDQRSFPVDLAYVPARQRERTEQHVARAIGTALAESDGDVLVFLPGVAEIRRTAALLDDLPVEVVVLHGRLTSTEQDRVLRPRRGAAESSKQGSAEDGADDSADGSSERLAYRTERKRRVVLATSIAESSLTVPGVRAVVDAGLSRVPRVDHRRGLAGLATVRVSRAVADQRAGRAGREAPGKAWRCWPENEHQTLPAYPEPEIRAADLTRLALELACWGTPDGSALTWLDAPPEGAMEAGRSVLRALGALDRTGNVGERGRRMADLGLHPRLARALLDGTPLLGARTTAEVVALLDDDSVTQSTDVVDAVRTLRAQRPARWTKEVDRLARLVGNADRKSPAHRTETPAQPDLAMIVALAYPERIARRRAPGSNSYLMAGGTAVTLPPGSLTDSEWLAVAVADREPGRAEGRIRLAATADEQLAREAAAELVTVEEQVDWVDNDVVARRVERVGRSRWRNTNWPNRIRSSSRTHSGAGSSKPASVCSPGHRRRPTCANASPSSTKPSARRGPQSTTRQSSKNWTAG